MDRRPGLSFWIVSWKYFHRNGTFKVFLIDFFSLIIKYAVVSTADAAFIIGGTNTKHEYFDTIAKFHDNKWTRYGSLLKGRYSPGAIVSGDQIMIIGGYSGGRTYVSKTVI